MSERGQRAARAARERLAQELTREAAGQGRLIEIGWHALKAVWLPPDAPKEQVKLMRWAFMAGAQHLFASIMVSLDPDAEPTDADMNKFALINAELEAFGKEVAAAVPVEGRA